MTYQHDITATRQLLIGSQDFTTSRLHEREGEEGRRDEGELGNFPSTIQQQKAYIPTPPPIQRNGRDVTIQRRDGSAPGTREDCGGGYPTHARHRRSTTKIKKINNDTGASFVIITGTSISIIILTTLPSPVFLRSSH